MSDRSGMAIRVEPQPAADGERSAAAAGAAGAAMRRAKTRASHRRGRKYATSYDYHGPVLQSYKISVRSVVHSCILN